MRGVRVDLLFFFIGVEGLRPPAAPPLPPAAWIYMSVVTVHDASLS